MSLGNVAADLRGAVRSERDQLLALCRELIRTPSENPPGDTRAAAALVGRFLTSRGVGYQVVAPNQTMPNIVATIGDRRSRPHLVLNGHLDTFPVGDRAGWSGDPFSGETRDGYLYGRGAADMRSGLAALLMACALLSRNRQHLSGRITLAVVSDEETFGPWGARHLLEHDPTLIGDAYLGAEPSSPALLRCGEKGFVWLEVRVQTPGAHGAMLHQSPNAIRVLAQIINEFDALADLSIAMPPEARALIEKNRATVDGELGAGMSDLLLRPTVNVGRFEGGAKINMVAAEARAQIDVRLPIGGDTQTVIRAAERIVAEHPGASLEVLNQSAPTFSDPGDRIFESVRAAASEVRGSEPAVCLSAPATDARLWRSRGVPAAIYGPRPYQVGGADEHIAIDDLETVCATQVLAAWRYLA